MTEDFMKPDMNAVYVIYDEVKKSALNAFHMAVTSHEDRDNIRRFVSPHTKLPTQYRVAKMITHDNGSFGFRFVSESGFV